MASRSSGLRRMPTTTKRRSRQDGLYPPRVSMAILSRTLERPLTQRISRAAHVPNTWVFIHDHDLASLDNLSWDGGGLPIQTIPGLPLAGD